MRHIEVIRIQRSFSLTKGMQKVNACIPMFKQFVKLEFVSLGEVFDQDIFDDSVFVVIDCNVFAFFAC